MTWLTTWPNNGRPAYSAHATEAAAEAHAAEIVKRGTAEVATYWHTETTEEA